MVEKTEEQRRSTVYAFQVRVDQRHGSITGQQTVRELLLRLADPEPDIRGAAAAELESWVPESSDIISGLKEAFLSEQQEQDRLCAGYFLAAMLEQLIAVARPAQPALEQLLKLFEGGDMQARREFMSSMDQLEQLVRKLPLTRIGEFGRNRLNAKGKRSSSGPNNPKEDVDSSARSPNTLDSSIVTDDIMDVSTQSNYGASEVARHLGVDVSTVEDWIASGEVAVRNGRTRTVEGYCLSEDDLRALKAYGVSLAAESLFDEPNEWLDNPNPWMGGCSPRELVGTNREQLVFDVLKGLKHGVVA